MFTSISWLQYILFIFLVLAAYYSWVAVQFYQVELIAFFKRLSDGKIFKARKYRLGNDEVSIGGTQSIQQELFQSGRKKITSKDEMDQNLVQALKVSETIKNVVREGVEREYIKEEFIQSLKVALKNHQNLAGTPFMVSINNLIATECEKVGYINLSADERVRLWNE